MYEMLIGYPPFYSDEPMATCRKVKSKFHYLLTKCTFLLQSFSWILVDNQLEEVFEVSGRGEVIY